MAFLKTYFMKKTNSIVLKKNKFVLIGLLFLTYGILIGKYEFPPYKTLRKSFYILQSFNKKHFAQNTINISEIKTNNIIQLLDKKDSLLLRIIVVGDGHFGENYVFWEKQFSTDYKLRYKMMINWLNDEVKNNGVDFVIFNGDNAHDDNSLLDEVKKHYDKLETNYYVVHGNHDYSTPEQWYNIWGYSWNYNFENKNYAFIILNSSFMPNSYDCANDSWLKEKLGAHKDKDGIFVFCHIPQHPWIYKNDINKELICKEITANFLKTKNLKMIVYSHAHYNDGHYKFKFNNYDFDFFFTGHFGHWGLPYYGYRVIEIFKNGKIFTYQYNPLTSKIMNFSEL